MVTANIIGASDSMYMLHKLLAFGAEWSL